MINIFVIYSNVLVVCYYLPYYDLGPGLFSSRLLRILSLIEVAQHFKYELLCRIEDDSTSSGIPLSKCRRRVVTSSFLLK